MRIVIIAALDANGTIGGPDGGIPWDLPRDRAHFRARTAGRALLVGRRTFEEMSGWFGDRRPIVLTRRPSYAHPEAAAVASSPAEAIMIARDRWKEPELVVCGGASVYAAVIGCSDELVLTIIQGVFPAGARFPAVDPGEWTRAASEHHPADADHPLAMEIVRLVRAEAPRRQA